MTDLPTDLPTNAPHDERARIWLADFVKRAQEDRAQLKAQADERAARPVIVRRTPASPNRRRTAGPPDAAQQTRLIQEAHQLAFAREQAFQAFERAATDIANM